jgi:hypothetical protein
MRVIAVCRKIDGTLQHTATVADVLLNPLLLLLLLLQLVLYYYTTAAAAINPSPKKKIVLTFQVLTAANMKMAVFWDVAR